MLSELLYLSLPYQIPDIFYHEILTPALAYPVKVLANETPEDVIENTIKSLVPAVTGILSPVVIPEVMSPMEIIPPMVGDKSTTAPDIGEKVLSGVGELYNWA